MLNRLILLVSLVATIVLLAMLNLTTPTEIGPLGVLVFFTMVYAAVFGFAVLVLWGLRKAAGKELVRKDYYYAVTVAFGPIMLLLVQSFDNLNFFTIGLVVLFVFLLCFLVKKRL